MELRLRKQTEQVQLTIKLKMGIYVCGVEDVEDKFEDFLQSCEGDVHADVIAECWNKLAKKYDWHDRLKAIEK